MFTLAKRHACKMLYNVSRDIANVLLVYLPFRKVMSMHILLYSRNKNVDT